MMDRALDWVFDYLMTPVIIVFCVALAALVFIGVPAIIYHAATTPPAEKFSLPVSDWHCGQSRQTMVTTYVMVGKIMTPIVTPVTECIAWVRNG